MASFKEAFASARKSGKKEFTWSGKRYNTKTKEDSKSGPTRPKARPEKAGPTRPKARPVKKGQPRRPVSKTPDNSKKSGPSRGLPGARKAIKRLFSGNTTASKGRRKR